MGLPVVERVADKLGVGPLVAFQRACDRYPQRCKVQRTQSWITETGIGQLGHLLPMVFEMRLVCSPNNTLHLLGTRKMQNMCFLHFLYLIVVVTIVVTGVATAMIDLWQIFSHQLFLQRTTRSFWLVEVSLTCWCMVLDIALLSKNCHMVGPDHPNKIFLGNHLTETERGDWVANHLLLVEDQVHCHLLMSSLHLTSLPPSLTWAQPSQGLALPGCLRHRRKQGRPWRTSMAKISLVLTLLATLGSSPNRPLLPPEPPAGLRRHQLLHGGAGLQAPDEPF